MNTRVSESVNGSGERNVVDTSEPDDIGKQPSPCCAGSNPVQCILLTRLNVPIDYWLDHCPFTAEKRDRYPLGIPRYCILFGISLMVE